MTRLAQAVPLFTQDGDSIMPDGLARTMKDLTIAMSTGIGDAGKPVDNLTEEELQQYVRLVANGFAARNRDMPDDVFPWAMIVYDITEKKLDEARPWTIAKRNITALPSVTEENRAYLADPNVMVNRGRQTPLQHVQGRAGAQAFSPGSGEQLKDDIDTLWNNGSPDIKVLIKLTAKAYDDNVGEHPDFAAFLGNIYSEALGLPVHVVAWDYPAPYLGVQHASIGVDFKDYPADTTLLEASSPKKLLPIGSLEQGMREDDAIADGIPEMRVNGEVYWIPMEANK